mgnify:CR=1 FL=1
MLGMAAVFAVGIIIYSRMTVSMQENFKYALSEARELGQYALIEKIGEGGMGIVYKATHKMMHRDTALKLLKNEACSDRDLKLFENEVRQTCKLNHPNTIRVYDYGKTDDGTFYYVMEYLEGMELDDIIKNIGAMPPSRVIHFLKQICASLNEAHKAGLVHRDIKAQNIFITNIGEEYDVVKVLDFGLVREVSDTDNSMVDNVSGTPRYMSPEAVLHPRDVDHLTDIYAIGILGFFMLTGDYPFSGSTPVAILMKHVNKTAPRPSLFLDEPLPKDLEDIIMKCLEKEKENRPQSTKEIISMLEKCEDYLAWTPSNAEKWWGKNSDDNNAVDEEASTQIEHTIQIKLS